MINSIKKDLKKFADPERARLCQIFFKTGSGEYGEGDKFLGLTVPQQRKIAKKYNPSLAVLQSLMESEFHEHRFTALVMLCNKYEKDSIKKYFDFYLANTRNINNWDLVDVTAPRIVGQFLFDKDRTILYKLAKSKDLWQKRISIISTAYFISKHQFEDTIKISEFLLKDSHDLIHKAVGWMLREVGKKDKKVLLEFLEKHHKEMPRTMLRYSIEKFEEKERKMWLNK